MNMIKLIDKRDNIEYAYLSIPIEHNKLIDKILNITAQIGLNILEDCNIVCSNKAFVIVKIWNSLHIIDYANTFDDNVKINELTSYLYKLLDVSNELSILGEVNVINIPKRYICTYNKVLNLFIKNINKLKSNPCSNKFIIKCYLAFNSAIANYNIKRYKEANLLINYVNAELKDIDFSKDVISSFIEGSSINKNAFKSIVNCVELELEVNPSTGKLTGTGTKELIDAFSLDINNHLKVDYENTK